MRTRLYLDETLAADCELELGGDSAQYLGRVLRLRPGDFVRVFNGRDGEFAAELVAFSKHAVSAVVRDLVVEPGEAATESSLRLHLVQGVSRGERMDLAIQKSTELGVKRITPVLTQHGNVRLDAKRAAKRQEHWQRVAVSATEQCGRLRPPLVDAPISLNDWLGATRDGKGDTTELVLDPLARQPLASISTPGTKLCLLVGPEGGLSEKEIGDAQVAGFQSVSLGPRVLRTETAAIAAVAVAQTVFGDLGRGPAD